MQFVLSTNRNMRLTTRLDRILSTGRNSVGRNLKLFLSFCVSLFLSLCISLTPIGLAQNYSADLFPMINGTEVQVLSENFLSVVTTGRIVQNRLELYNQLNPTQKVQVIFSNAQTGEVGILPAIVSFEGDDLLIPVANNSSNTATTYISLRNWLLTSKGITLNTSVMNY